MLFDVPNCSECTYLDLDRGPDCGKFYCSKHYERHYADEKKCDDYCRAYSRSDRDIKNAEEISRDYRYYILTAICRILGMDHYNAHLKALKDLSDNYLSKCALGRDLLGKYDIVGPIVASYIENSSYKLSIATTLLQNFIIPTTNCVENNDFKGATRLYISMTERLMEYYKVDLVNDECIEKNSKPLEIKRTITA